MQTDWLGNTCQKQKRLNMSAINKSQSIQRKLTSDQERNLNLKHHMSAFTNKLSKFALACWIHDYDIIHFNVKKYYLYQKEKKDLSILSSIHIFVKHWLKYTIKR